MTPTCTRFGFPWRNGVPGCLSAPALLAVILLHAPGCARAPKSLPPHPSASWYRAPDCALQEVRRVVVLPMEHTPQDSLAAQRFRMAMAAAFQTTGRFEVLCPPVDYFLCWQDDSLIRGAPSRELLSDVARHFAADGVVFSTLTAYEVYGLPRISVVVHLVCTYNGTALASVDGQWDAQNAVVSERAVAFARQEHLDDRLARPEMILKTPSWYERFVAHELAGVFSMPPF